MKALYNLYDKFHEVADQENTNTAIKHATKFITKNTIRRVVTPPSVYFHSYFSDHFNILKEDWDLLIILDACRVDALRHVRDEYEFIDRIDTRWSVGSQSAEWMVNTFNSNYKSEISQIAHVTSNPHALTVFMNGLREDHHGESKQRIDWLRKYTVKKPVSLNEFGEFILLYDDSEDYGQTKYPSPRSVTDHVVNLDRRNDTPDRIVAHYMPPHSPHIAQRVDGEIKFTDQHRPSDSFDAYLDNLRWGLNEVSLLLENVDRDKVVITADHGENFSLRSIRANHYPGMINPSVRRVPWVRTSGSDKQTHDPDLSGVKETSMSPEETLKALGYI